MVQENYLAFNVCYNLSMSRRKIEYQPHYRPEPEPRPEFGQPLPPKRSRRRSLSTVKKEVVSQNLGLLPVGESEIIVGETSRRKRDWETYVLDRGTGTQETIKGRSYSIGVNHAPIDIWTSPPETWGAKRIESVKNVRIIALRREKPQKKDEASDVLVNGWTQAYIVNGASKPRSNVIVPMQFSDGLGSREIVSVQWSQVRR